jgi:hypothetical protein
MIVAAQGELNAAEIAGRIQAFAPEAIPPSPAFILDDPNAPPRILP